MGDIDEAIDRADREAFTREPPKSVQARIRFLIKHLKTAKAVAREIGVTADSVNRYRRGVRKHPPQEIVDRIDAAVRARWQPQVRRRRREQAATSTGITVETRARFGYTAPVGTTDDGRLRRLTIHLPPEYARHLFDARERGADDQRMRAIIAEGLQEIYFKDGGRRADQLEVEFTDIDYIDVSF
ncbi:XRE family transcriptional regulator [Streptomyces sp. AV19]|uniref:telomere-protecting terminal protein Tpg n=1 Tax=Streptomyces sp. AV19 TaxID=2793068 RepID=UPI0018FE2F2B|nr:XRE family transcriptional regulator [Streptomyces sp. AV19]MBH1935788.1 XRE family transcriptional regulator [Streptomyces sp. AV19]MDG4536090.1 XRE family transcriptional regulator [Streptomyces sp. AV19]